MFGLGLPELIVIFILALIVFGPKKLPDLGKSIGRAMAEFKKAQQEFQNTVQTEMRDIENKAELEKLKEVGKIDFNAPAEPDVVTKSEETGPTGPAPEQANAQEQAGHVDQDKVGEAKKNG